MPPRLCIHASMCSCVHAQVFTCKALLFAFAPGTPMRCLCAARELCVQSLHMCITAACAWLIRCPQEAPLRAEIVAKVSTVYRFTGLADFHNTLSPLCLEAAHDCIYIAVANLLLHTPPAPRKKRPQLGMMPRHRRYLPVDPTVASRFTCHAPPPSNKADTSGSARLGPGVGSGAADTASLPVQLSPENLPEAAEPSGMPEPMLLVPPVFAKSDVPVAYGFRDSTTRKDAEDGAQAMFAQRLLGGWRHCWC
eukprot:350436-Chlamydomonas_euryale.AAC.6